MYDAETKIFPLLTLFGGPLKIFFVDYEIFSIAPDIIRWLDKILAEHKYMRQMGEWHTLHTPTHASVLAEQIVYISDPNLRSLKGATTQENQSIRQYFH